MAARIAHAVGHWIAVVVDIKTHEHSKRTRRLNSHNATAVIKADSADHALTLANDTAYGLSSAVLTNDLQLAMKFALKLEAGMVHINGPTVHDEATVPFGGVKDSGNGREGGRWSMDELTETKSITIQLGQRQYPF